MLVRASVWNDVVDHAPRWRHNCYKYIYYSTFCRFDELVAGVGLALLKHYHAGLWRRITGHGNLLLAAGTAVTGLAFWLFLRDHFSFTMTVCGCPMLALVPSNLAPSAAPLTSPAS
jgi:peptidoglycan/LPS O-acetylase OafA/YrhL